MSFYLILEIHLMYKFIISDIKRYVYHVLTDNHKLVMISFN